MESGGKEKKNWIKKLLSKMVENPASFQRFSSATFREPIYRKRVQNQSESWNKGKFAGEKWGENWSGGNGRGNWHF